MANFFLFFLTSRDDRCIQKDHVEEFSVFKASERVDVEVIDFEDSPHVGHLDKYPDKYREEIEKFVKKLDLWSNWNKNELNF